MIFANSLDDDQAQQNIGPEMNLNCFTLLSHNWRNVRISLIDLPIQKYAQRVGVSIIHYRVTGHIPNNDVLLSLKIALSSKKNEDPDEMSHIADDLCKQFGPQSCPTECQAWSGSKLFWHSYGVAEGFWEQLTLWSPMDLPYKNMQKGWDSITQPLRKIVPCSRMF